MSCKFFINISINFKTFASLKIFEILLSICFKNFGKKLFYLKQEPNHYWFKKSFKQIGDTSKINQKYDESRQIIIYKKCLTP